MGLQDLIVTPIYLLIFYAIAIVGIKKFSSKKNRKFFLPALTLKFVGAIFLGIVYQFYYQGGDTFNYWTYGSAYIWEAFIDSPINGLSMIFGDITDPEYYEYYSKIWLKRSESSVFIVRLAAFFDLLTLHTYSATALFFGLISFCGSWAFFESLTNVLDANRKYIAAVIFIVPSIIFWGSGILKDSITLGALGLVIASLIRLIELKNRSLYNLLALVLASFVIYKIKVYVLICLFPAVFLWIYLKNMQRIRSVATRVLIAPVFLIVFGATAFLSTQAISEENSRYSLENIPQLSMITAYDIGFWTGKDAGSGYTLGELDGTWQTMISLAPAAINVSLFRPYVWEVSSLFMLLTALESLILFVLTIRAVIFRFQKLRRVIFRPIVAFFVTYSLAFAFAVGVSTFNFGTLARYRIPILPFFGVVLVIANTNSIRQE